MTESQMFRTRADEAMLAADDTPLANVRDRYLRAAAAWEEMAQRALRRDRHREEDAARRAERDEAAAAAPVEPAPAFASRDG